MAKDLRTFLDSVRKLGPEYYVELKKEVDTYMEPYMIQQKLAAENKFPVIYCPHVKGYSQPLVTDTFGSYDLLGLALDMAPGTVSKKSILQEFAKRSSNLIPPVEISREEAPCKAVVMTGDDVDLNKLPFTHHAELDHGKYITAGFCIMKDPATGIYNAGWYRHEILNKNTITAMINPSNHGKYIGRACAERGERLPVALAIGHHPAVVMGSCVGGSIDMCEYDVMGGLTGEPIRLVKAETVDLLVPADAEVILEGYIEHPEKEVPDGPFAEFAGYYGHVMPSYEITITGITTRKDAIMHELDPAHVEHNLSGVLAYELNHYNALTKAFPSVTGVHLPPSGCCMFHVYIQMHKGVQGEAKRAAMLSLSSVSMCKMAIVVDDDVDIYNERDVMWAVATRCQGDRNIQIIPAVTGSHLDPLAYGEDRDEVGTLVTKVIIDATKPLGKEFAPRVKPKQSLMDSIVLEDYL